MSSPSAPAPVLHNVRSQRFEIPADGQAAFLSYSKKGVRVIFDHTYVPESLRGKGIAAALTRAALDEARRESWEVVPACSYVADYIGRHPEYAGLVVRAEET